MLFRSALPISTDATPLSETEPRIITLARSQGLSSYDASYLELAHRLGASLASFDARLNRAAEAVGVALAG